VIGILILCCHWISLGLMNCMYIIIQQGSYSSIYYWNYWRKQTNKTPRELGCWFRWQNVELVAFSEQLHTTPTPGVRASEWASERPVRSIIQVEQPYMLRRTLVHSNGHTSLFLNRHTLTVFSSLITLLLQFFFGRRRKCKREQGKKRSKMMLLRAGIVTRPFPSSRSLLRSLENS
jgi:hypothetical protein